MRALLIPWPVLGKNTGFPREELKLERVFIAVLFADVMWAQLPKMPPWPKQRVSESLPFQFTGLDYLGPVFVKESKGITKMWICLFTCLPVRVVHLEWVRSLSQSIFFFV